MNEEQAEAAVEQAAQASPIMRSPGTGDTAAGNPAAGSPSPAGTQRTDTPPANTQPTDAQQNGTQSSSTPPTTLLGNPERFEPLSPERAEVWSRFPPPDEPLFVHLVGLKVVEIRLDYCRIELPFRPDLLQGGGAVHGGVIFTLLDTACVPAVGSGFDEARGYATIDSHVQFVGAVTNEDLVAAAWVTKRGRSIAFCEAQVATAVGRPVARGAATFKI